MKRTFSLFLAGILSFLLSSASLMAQMPVFPLDVAHGDTIGNVKLTAVFRLNFLTNPLDTASVVTDEILLQIGDGVQKEFSNRLYENDLSQWKVWEQGQLPSLVYELVPPVVIYKNYPENGTLTVDYRLPMNAPVMRYEESVPQIPWKLETEKKTIAGMSCQKATGKFGGRSWEVWFAPDLPFPYGPYKFGGLPGLILEACDTEGEYHYTCTGFRPDTEGIPIIGWNWNPRKTTKGDLLRLLKSMHATPEATMKALGQKIQFGGDAMVDLPYNPIERE